MRELASGALRALHNSGGAIYWRDGEPEPIVGLRILVQMGYAKEADGGGWSATEGVRITPAGLRALGIEPAPTLMDRLRRLFRL